MAKNPGDSNKQGGGCKLRSTQMEWYTKRSVGIGAVRKLVKFCELHYERLKEITDAKKGAQGWRVFERAQGSASQ